MISLMSTVPANVVAFRATGNVTKEDYETVVIPAIDALVQQQEHINFLLVLDTEVGNFSMGAFLQDLGVGLKHFKKWRKMAIVSEQPGVIKFTEYFSYIAPGEARGFDHAALQEAIQWVSA